MTFNIPTTKDKIFKQYLNILNPVIGKKKLTSTEIEVMSKLLLIKALYTPKLSEEQLNLICFHPDTKKNIRQTIADESKIVISEASFNNILMSLRKKDFLKGNTIAHKPFINDDGNISLTFNLNIK